MPKLAKGRHVGMQLHIEIETQIRLETCQDVFGMRYCRLVTWPFRFSPRIYHIERAFGQIPSVGQVVDRRSAASLPRK